MYVKTGDHMNKPKIILSTSLKGGVGKSTVAANVAYQLSLYGYRVLLCDLDFDVRSLDLIMGYENSVLFDICDVLSGRRQYNDAKITDGKAFDVDKNSYIPDFISGNKKLLRVEQEMKQKLYEDNEKKLLQNKIISTSIDSEEEIVEKIIELLEGHKYANQR